MGGEGLRGSAMGLNAFMATIGGCLNGGCRLCIDMFFPGLSLFPLRCSHTGTPFAFAFANLA